MDTTQALLDGAQVSAGKHSFTTSYDGRVVLKPEQLEGLCSLSIDCEGYESKKMKIDGNTPLIVQLVPKASKHPKEHGKSYSVGAMRGAKGAVAYSLATTADGAIYDEVVVEKAIAAPMEAMYSEKPNNAVSAGKLTAGEVNDFAKWSLWPSIIDSTHAQYTAQWNITPRHRYTVQVTNQYGFPIANYPVSLTDKKGNTVFQAVTDNTGKAELWNGLVGPMADVDQPAWQSLIVDEPCQAPVTRNPSPVTSNPSDIDIVFIFDVTGSMGDELHYLQAEMKDVISRAKEATGGLSIRTGAVVYRDHGDEYITRISRLTDDIATTQQFIAAQRADGGGDFPEAVPEALMAALNSSGWNADARTRIAFLILDAPCHQDSATLALLHDQLLNASAQGIRLVPIVCSGLDKGGEYLMRAMALATNGTSFFLTDDSGIGNPHLKPTTDTLAVEHLNDMLVRTIVEFSTMPSCDSPEDVQEVNDQFLPNPFEVADLNQDPSIPHGEGIHYLIDVSGKLITIFEGEIYNYQEEVMNLHLPIGLYFIKTFYDGQWHTQKILIR